MLRKYKQNDLVIGLGFFLFFILVFAVSLDLLGHQPYEKPIHFLVLVMILSIIIKFSLKFYKKNLFEKEIGRKILIAVISIISLVTLGMIVYMYVNYFL